MWVLDGQQRCRLNWIWERGDARRRARLRARNLSATPSTSTASNSPGPFLASLDSAPCCPPDPSPASATPSHSSPAPRHVPTTTSSSPPRPRPTLHRRSCPRPVPALTTTTPSKGSSLRQTTPMSRRLWVLLLLQRSRRRGEASLTVGGRRASLSPNSRRLSREGSVCWWQGSL
jgi:hypothetical protein